MWTSLRIYIYKIVDFINGLSGLLYRTGWTSVNGILNLVVECPDPVNKSIGTFTFSLCLGRTDLAEFQLDTKIFKKRSNPGMNFTFTARDGYDGRHIVRFKFFCDPADPAIDGEQASHEILFCFSYGIYIDVFSGITERCREYVVFYTRAIY